MRRVQRMACSENGLGLTATISRSPDFHGPAMLLDLHVVLELVIHMLGGEAQRHLAQRGEVAHAKEVLRGQVGALGRVDLAFGQPFAQLVRRQVDQFDFIGQIEQRVGHLLMHSHTGDLPHGVGAALEVLDVDGRVHVDAGFQQFEHVLVALAMAHAGRVGVGQFVDQDQAPASAPAARPGPFPPAPSRGIRLCAVAASPSPPAGLPSRPDRGFPRSRRPRRCLRPCACRPASSMA
jgi:hypothetical protein